MFSKWSVEVINYAITYPFVAVLTMNGLMSRPHGFIALTAYVAPIHISNGDFDNDLEQRSLLQ